MRISIREQLGALVLLASLIGLAVISIATWYTNHSFVLGIRASRLALIASLKASQLASNLMVMDNNVESASTRVIIQEALQNYNNGNYDPSNFNTSIPDLEAALNGAPGVALLLQGQIFPNNDRGPNGTRPLVSATGAQIVGLALPYKNSKGSTAILGDADLGFPPTLYPNLTVGTVVNSAGDTVNRAYFEGTTLDEASTLLLGPLIVNETFSLVSLTMPMINNTSATDILGWLTCVLDARLIYQVLSSAEALDQTGNTLLISPANVTNRFPPGIVNSNENPPSDVDVHFVLPPNNSEHRHEAHAYGTAIAPFSYADFPAVKRAVTQSTGVENDAGAILSTHNEQGRDVSIGYAMPNTDYVNWVIIVEQDKWEVWQPITHLRTILLACVFGTAGALLLLAFPLAHYCVSPIRRLRDATKKSVAPPGYSDDEFSPVRGDATEDGGDARALARKEGFFGRVTRLGRLRRRGSSEKSDSSSQRRRGFRIPSKVKEGKHFIHDELTDLTHTFNEMSDELMMQYERLEERVAQRTAELELSKKAAEAANESKTLFIANISHELKTPLNGILGMAAICMAEEDPIKLKRSLGIIYKSGDLLLNLLNDLLTFSKNQVGQQVTLDEREFRLRDVSSQVVAIFDKQATEGGVDLRIKWEGSDSSSTLVNSPAERRDHGPSGTGRVKDMILWGDQHRILQVVINLISNSLKFTPKGGSVTLTIRCTREAEDSPGRGSVASRTASGRTSRISRNRGSETSAMTTQNFSTANEINVQDKSMVFSRVRSGSSQRSPSPPPGKTFFFEFEVEDTGPGIPKAQQQRIFEPFVQADLGLSKKFGGTGLGLSICQQLAGLMKGSISLRSEEGVGSSFTMEIPLRHLKSRADSTASSSYANLPQSHRTSFSNDEIISGQPNDDATSTQSLHSANGPGSSAPVPFEQDSQPRLVGLSAPFFAASTPLDTPSSQSAAIERIEAQAAKEGDKVRVLVAEDNKTNQEVVHRMLNLESVYDVTIAQDGQEALDFVKESLTNNQPYNLIFMDIQMPNLDGLQSTRLIRQAGYSAPIVALSAYAEESNKQACLESGMNTFLSKPIRRPQLKQVLKTYFPPIPEEEGDVTPPEKSKPSIKPPPSPRPPVSPKPPMSPKPTASDSNNNGKAPAAPAITASDFAVDPQPSPKTIS